MKRNLLLLAAVISIMCLQAQDASLVWSSSSMSWFGIDFTKAKILGFQDSPHTIRDQYFKDWNDVTIPMDLTKMFDKKAVYKDPNGILKDDRARETETMNQGDDVELTEDEIAARVKEMGTGSKKAGLGMMFIVQSINKGTETALVNVVFFDIATRKVVWSKKLSAKVSGGNTKSAVAAAMKDIFTQIDKKEWKAWRKEANF